MFANPAAVDVPCRILLSSWQAELVSGEREEGVRRVRAESGANVQILDRTLPAAFRNRDECLAVIRSDGAEQLRLAISGTLRRAFKAQTSRITSSITSSETEEKQRTVEVMIPEVACRHLVGAGGDRIKLLREEAGCEVQLAPGVVAGVAAQRRVRCGGSLAGVAEAVARVHEVLVEFAAIGILHPRHFDLQEIAVVAGASSGIAAGHRDQIGASGAAKNSRVAVRLMVSKDECGWMIGKRGNKIHKLRELALVSTRDADSEIMREGSESVVEIFGAPLGKELCVLQLIVDDLAMMREAFPITRLVVPMELRHAVADRLEDIKRESHAAAVSLPVNGQDWSVLEIEGSERERLAAAGILHQILEQAAEQQAAANGTGRAQGTFSRGTVGGPNGSSVNSNNANGVAGSSRPASQPTTAAMGRHSDVIEVNERSRPIQPATVTMASHEEAQHVSCMEESSHTPPASQPVARPAGREWQQVSADQSRSAGQFQQSIQEIGTKATSERLQQLWSEIEQAAHSASSAPAAPPGVTDGNGEGQADRPEATTTAPVSAPAVAAAVPAGGRDPDWRGAIAAQKNIASKPSWPEGPIGNVETHTTLHLSIASLTIAQRLASEESGIARRAGVTLSVEMLAAPGGFKQPTLQMTGTPIANAVACYLVQKVLWLNMMLGKP